MVKVNGEVRELYNLATLMKVIINLIRNMVKEFLHGPVVIFIKVITLRMNETVMVRCCGLTVACMKESGQKVYSMDWVAWSFQMGSKKKAISKIMFLSTQ